MSGLADDYAGLEAFIADAAAGKQPKPRKVVATEGASALEVLRSVLSAHFLRVIDVFRNWDEDGNHLVSRKEFRQGLSMMGLVVERSDADAFFDGLDVDGNGVLDLGELHRALRPAAAPGEDGADLGLDPSLRPGAAGEIQTFAAMRGSWREHGLVEGVSTVLGQPLQGSSTEGVVMQLQQALAASLMRTVELFREWDADGSGSVSRREFRRALPALGLVVAPAEADALFASLDDDGSGSIEYAELHRKLREKRVLRGPGAKGHRSERPAQEATHGQQQEHSQPQHDQYTSEQQQQPERHERHERQHRSIARQAAKAEELRQRERVTKLKRQLARAQRMQAQAETRQAKLAAAQEFKREHERRLGKDIVDRIAAVSPATVEQQKLVSTQISRISI